MAHANLSHPLPVLRLCLESVKAARTKEDLLRSHSQPQKLMTGQGGGLPLFSTSIAAPLSSRGGPAVLVPGLLEVHDRGLLRTSISPTWSSTQFHLSAAIDHQSDALSAARGKQQERASEHRDSLYVGEGGHQESVKQVVYRVLEFSVCHPQKE